MADNLNSNKTQTLATANILLICLPTLALPLRFISRRLTPKGLWYDDYAMVCALPLALAVPILNLIAMSFGFGRHESALNQEMTKRSMEVSYVVQFFYISAITMVKLALLLTYARIWITRGFRRCLYLVGAIIAVWWCTSTFITIFQCHPIPFFWDREIVGDCLASRAFFIGMAVPNIVLDLVVLSIPLPSIWQLQLPRLQKAALTVVFTVGLLATAASIYRVGLFPHVRDVDPTYRWVDLGIWSAIEPTIGITVASLATCKPLFLRITDGLSTRIQSSRWTIASTTKHGIRIPIPIVKASPKPDDKGLRPVKNHIQGRWPIAAEGGKRAVQDDELSRHWFSESPA